MINFIKTKRKKLIASLLVIFLLLPQPVKSAAWYDNFTHRKQISITNPNTTALDNYQIKLTLHEGSGTDSGSDIYLNGNVMSNFNDIRFSSADGTTLLPYWIESINAGAATVWVKINSLNPSTTTDIYSYYSSSGASSQSDAQAVFPFFDNFDTNGIAGWTGSEEDVDHAQETGNQHQLVSTSQYASSPNSAQLGTYASCFSGPFDGVRSLITASPNLSSGNYTVDFSVKLQITGFRYTTTAVQRSRVRVNGTEKYYNEINCSGTNCTTEGTWSNQSFTINDAAINSIALVADSYDCTSGNTYYDNVRVRKYAANEPTIGSIAQEEVFGTSHTNSQSSTSAPYCPDSTPAGSPDLFQIDTTQTNAKLFFTPLADASKYFISFSTQPSAEEHGAEVSLGNTGVQNYTVNLLSPGTEYFFKVRGQHGCMPGGWSEVKKANTKQFVNTTIEKPQRKEISPNVKGAHIKRTKTGTVKKK